jgi:D-3-phosphoglycerate dehydrogenase / 2-oxoglutarate reductase
MLKPVQHDKKKGIKMGAKILIATEKPFDKNAVEGIKEILSKAGYDVNILEKYSDKNELLKAGEDAKVLLVRSDIVNREVIEGGKKLKMVVRAGAGIDNIDLEAAKEKNVVVLNTPGQNANAVAELTLGMMVFYARNLFSGKPGTELKGKTLGIHGFGYVGKNVARIAKGFDMEIYAYDAFIQREEIETFGIRSINSVEELYKTCRYVSIHIPANDQTRNSINYGLLSTMPQGAVLVNTARKEVIDEKSLLKMFEQREDFGYIADVEPDCAAVIKEKCRGRYFFTPKKMGAQTAEANRNAGIAAAKQIISYFEKDKENNGPK